MADFLSGVLMTSYLVAGLLFLKFWRSTRDRLFIHFAAAFWMLAVQRVGFEILGEKHEHVVYLYLLRLTAFVLIILAIIDKNRAEAKSKAAE